LFSDVFTDKVTAHWYQPCSSTAFDMVCDEKATEVRLASACRERSLQQQVDVVHGASSAGEKFWRVPSDT